MLAKAFEQSSSAFTFKGHRKYHSYFNGRFTNRTNGKEGFFPAWSWSEAMLWSVIMIPQAKFILWLWFFLKLFFLLFFLSPFLGIWQEGIQFVTFTACPSSSATPSPRTNFLSASAGSRMCSCSKCLRHDFNVIDYYHRDLGCACFSCFLYNLPPVPSWMLTLPL